MAVRCVSMMARRWTAERVLQQQLRAALKFGAPARPALTSSADDSIVRRSPLRSVRSPVNFACFAHRRIWAPPRDPTGNSFIIVDVWRGCMFKRHAFCVRSGGEVIELRSTVVPVHTSAAIVQRAWRLARAGMHTRRACLACVPALARSTQPCVGSGGHRMPRGSLARRLASLTFAPRISRPVRARHLFASLVSHCAVRHRFVCRVLPTRASCLASISTLRMLLLCFRFYVDVSV
jgi:hypothetical protein